jgi:hypothetical protein
MYVNEWLNEDRFCSHTIKCKEASCCVTFVFQPQYVYLSCYIN